MSQKARNRRLFFSSNNNLFSYHLFFFDPPTEPWIETEWSEPRENRKRGKQKKVIRWVHCSVLLFRSFWNFLIRQLSSILRSGNSQKFAKSNTRITKKKYNNQDGIPKLRILFFPNYLLFKGIMNIFFELHYCQIVKIPNIQFVKNIWLPPTHVPCRHYATNSKERRVHPSLEKYQVIVGNIIESVTTILDYSVKVQNKIVLLIGKSMKSLKSQISEKKQLMSQRLHICEWKINITLKFSSKYPKRTRYSDKRYHFLTLSHFQFALLSLSPNFEILYFLFKFHLVKKKFKCKFIFKVFRILTKTKYLKISKYSQWLIWSYLTIICAVL